jgi:DNA-binding transcriptional regulator YbjK
MADKTAKPGMDDLVNSIIGSIQMTSAIQTAVQNQIEGALTAAAAVTADLIKTNVSNSQLAEENLKIQKAVIDLTITSIKALAPKSTPPSGSDT